MKPIEIWQWVTRLLKRTVSKFFADNGFFLASGLSFDLLLYCMPLSLLAVSGLGYTLVDSEQALAWVQESLRHLLPGTHQAFFDALSQIIANRGPLGVVGCLAFFLLSSSLFGSIRYVLNRVFCIKRPRSFLHGKCVDFILMFSMSLLIIITVGIELLGAVVNTLAAQWPSLTEWVQRGWLIFTDVLGFFFTAGLFFLLYRFSPAKAIETRALIIGSLVGACLFAISKLAFSWYVHFAQSITALYGALGGLLFFFLWLFYSSLVFIVGAELAWAYHEVSRAHRFSIAVK